MCFFINTLNNKLWQRDFSYHSFQLVTSVTISAHLQQPQYNTKIPVVSIGVKTLALLNHFGLSPTFIIKGNAKLQLEVSGKCNFSHFPFQGPFSWSL